MVPLYLDEDAPEDLVSLLVERGRFVATTRGEGRKAAPDPRQLLYAAGRGWAFVTLNRSDYRLLHDAWLMWSHEWGVHPSHAGILILEHVRRADFPVVANAIHDLVRVADISLPNRLFDWGPTMGWRHWPR